MLVDLHLHSTFSDGRYTPTELVQAAVMYDIRLIALTDHDSWNGFPEAEAEAKRLNVLYAELKAAGKDSEEAVVTVKEQLSCLVKKAELKSLTGAPESGLVSNINPENLGCDINELPLITVLAGTEISTLHEERAVHVLGYHIDRSCQPLLNKLNEMRFKREHRLEEILEKCLQQGMAISVEACDPSARAVGRPHVAKAMVAMGFVQTVQEAFDKYLHRGGPCYVAQPKMSPLEAVELIHKAGGLAFLAHPSEIENTEVPEFLLQNIPFDGLEIWHPSVRYKDETNKWLQLAKKYHLLVSGGSDFHGIPDRFPAKLGIWQVVYADVKELLQKIM